MMIMINVIFVLKIENDPELELGTTIIKEEIVSYLFTSVWEIYPYASTMKEKILLSIHSSHNSSCLLDSFLTRILFVV